MQWPFAVLTQLAIDNGEELFDVDYDDTAMNAWLVVQVIHLSVSNFTIPILLFLLDFTIQ